jgi:hypothetical protein
MEHIKIIAMGFLFLTLGCFLYKRYKPRLKNRERNNLSFLNDYKGYLFSIGLIFIGTFALIMQLIKWWLFN